MEISLKKSPPKSGMATLLLVILRRMIALFFLVFTLVYWARIVGMFPGTETRFDTLSQHWQVASVILAVAMPVAALGLWGLFSWGTLSWLAVIAVELTMYVGMPEKYGHPQYVIWFHLACLASYIAIKLYIRFAGRRP